MSAFLKITICLLLLITTSCYCINVYFDKGDTFWTDPYKKGDLLIFKSNKGRIDSIKIIDKSVNIANGKCNPLEISNYSTSGIRLDYATSHDKWSDTDYFVQLGKGRKDEKVIPVIRLFNLEYSDDNDSSIYKTSLYINTLKLNLIHCFRFQPTHYTNLGPPQESITTFYWDYKLGLVRYDNSKGEFWELVKRI